MNEAEYNEAENAAYAAAYWLINILCPGAFPLDKAELAAETSIRYYATHKSRDEALSYIRTFGLYESEFWKSL